MPQIALALVLLASALRPGQTPAPQAPASEAQAPASGAQPPAGAPAPAPQRPSGEVYTYSSEGRRDPFVNLIGTGGEPRAAARRTEGPATMAVADISVRGIMQSRGGLVAMVQGPDNKTYIVHQGEKFLDGRLKSITPQTLVIIQEVNDPLSLVKQREIRKPLRSLEDVKE